MVPVAIHRASNFEGGGASKSFGGCRAIQVKVSYDHSAQPRPQLRLERPPPQGGGLPLIRSVLWAVFLITSPKLTEICLGGGDGANMHQAMRN